MTLSEKETRAAEKFNKLIDQCLEGPFSPEALMSGGEKRAVHGLSLPADREAFLDTIFLVRLPRLIRDLCDYGKRENHIFPADDLSDIQALASSVTVPGTSGYNAAVTHRSRQFPDEPLMDESSFGECMERIYLEAHFRYLSTRTLEWLLKYDYSVDWLFYGTGLMVKDFYQASPASGSMVDPVSGKISYQTISDLKLYRAATASPWAGMDWFWLLNAKANTRFECKAPTLPLTVRIVCDFGLASPMPGMPNITVFGDWLWRFIIREFVRVEQQLDGWRQRVIEDICLAKNKVYILLGLTAQAGTQYRTGRSLPSAGALKLAFYIEMIVRRYGREGFLRYMDMLNDEAVLRGFEDLSAVMKRRSWRLDTDRRSSFGRPRGRKNRNLVARMAAGKDAGTNTDTDGGTDDTTED